jgi:hypothetical protein
MDNLSALYCLKENLSIAKKYGTPDQYLGQTTDFT